MHARRLEEEKLIDRTALIGSFFIFLVGFLEGDLKVQIQKFVQVGTAKGIQKKKGCVFAVDPFWGREDYAIKGQLCLELGVFFYFYKENREAFFFLSYSIFLILFFSFYKHH